MPLIKGKSQKSFVKNLKTEMEAGKPQKQSLAIAYAMKRKAQHKAKGGYLKGDEMYPHAKDKTFDVTNKYADGGEFDSAEASPAPEPMKFSAAPQKQSSGGGAGGLLKLALLADGGDPQDPQQPEATSPVSQDDKWQKGADSLASAFGKKHAKGGFIAEEKSSGYDKMPQEHEKMNGPAHQEDDEEFNQEPVDPNTETSVAEQDMVGRIMHKMSQSFANAARLSQGGQVANDTGTGQDADEMPNQFDDMVLDDDLESSYGDDDNAGDALGNKQEDEDRKDIVARIMASRRKKDRLPSPA